MQILILLLCVELLLAFTSRPAWGQLHHQETVGAQGHEPSGQPRQAPSDIPVDDLDRGTPRRAVRRLSAGGPRP